MKTLASILLLASAAEAFSPSSTTTTTSITITSSTSLNHSVNTRHRIEDQELGIWPQTSTDRSSANYVPGQAVSGHDVRGKWTSYAPKHGSPDTIGAIGAVSRETLSLNSANYGAVKAVSGEDIRESRTSYAPYNVHEGRVGSLGVVGSDGSSSGPVGPSRALPSFGSSSISSSGAAGTTTTPKFGGTPRTATGGPTKKYGLGSWKK